MRIGLLNNLRAGRSDAQVTRLLSFLKQHPDVVHAETDSAGALPEALADLSRHEVALLVVNGGDGTLQHALTEILGNGVFEGRVPMVAPLRGGRTNMSALDLGASRDPIKGMARLIDAAKSGRLAERTSWRQVLRVEHGRPRKVHYGMFCGVGMIHRAIELAHRTFTHRRTQGVVGATLVTGALTGKLVMRKHDGVLMPDKVQILLDGEMMERGEFSLLIVSTLTRLFAGMRPFWGTGPESVRFTAIATGAPQLWKAIPGMLRGRPARHVTDQNGYTSRNVGRAELRADCGFTVDGELIRPEPGRILSITADQGVRFVRA